MKTVEEARELLKRDAKQFVITQGKNGATMWDGSVFIDIEPHPVQAVDTTGAGDMFAGSFMHAYIQGIDISDCAKFGNYASSKIVETFGPRLDPNGYKEVLNKLRKS